MSVGLIDMRFCADVFEGAVTAVVVENICCGGESLWAAHDRDAFPDAGGALTGSGCGGEIEVDIVGDHYIEVAIAIVVDEGAAVAPGLAGTRDPCFFAYVGECSVAV